MHGEVSSEVLRAVYYLVAAVPLACGVVQLLAWSAFDLHGERQRLVTEWSARVSAQPTPNGSVGAALRSESCAHLDEGDGAAATSSSAQLELELSLSTRKPAGSGTPRAEQALNVDPRQ